MKTAFVFLTCFAAAVALSPASPAAAQSNAAQTETDIPGIAQALLNAAYETGDVDEIAAVARAVKAVFADHEAAIGHQAASKIAEFETGAEPASESTAGAKDVTVTKSPFAVSPWDGKIQASGLFSSGNSDNAAVGVAINAARTAGDFVHKFKAFYDLGSSNQVTNKKRWGAAYQLDYNFSPHTYSYGRFSYEEDEFSGFDYRLFTGVGLGHFFAKSDPFKWKVEGGPGFRYSPIDDTRAVEQEFAVYGSSELDWVIRDGLVFEQDFNSTWTSPTTTFQSVTALTTALTDSLSTAISFEYRYETAPPLGRENTDTTARASLTYGF